MAEDGAGKDVVQEWAGRQRAGWWIKFMLALAASLGGIEGVRALTSGIAHASGLQMKADADAAHERMRAEFDERIERLGLRIEQSIDRLGSRIDGLAARRQR